MSTDYVTTVIKWAAAHDAVRRYELDYMQPGPAKAQRENLAAQIDNHLAGIADTALRTADTLTRSAEEARQSIGKIGDAAERDRAWSRVKLLLDAGRTVESVIDEETDPVALSAIAETGPYWVRAQAPRNDDPADPVHYAKPGPDTQWIANRVCDRMTELPNAPEIAVKARAAIAAAASEAAWGNLLSELAANGKAGYASAAALHVAEGEQVYRSVSDVLFATPQPSRDDSPLQYAQVQALLPPGIRHLTPEEAAKAARGREMVFRS